MDKGAHFHRCDFQVHTPRDRQWVGPECTSESDRKQYGAELIAACREKGISAIAVTDHHDLMFAKYVRDAARTEKDEEGDPVAPGQQIVVFPGLELTLAVPCQAILLFDADFPDDMFSLVLNALAIVPAPPGESRTAETKRVPDIATLQMLKDALDKHQYLRDRYIILPNVSERGTDTLLRSGAGPKYAQMPCVGGYLDGPDSQLGKGNRSILDGKASEYGHKRIAYFQTSDNRNVNHADLGKHSTWVKWAVPTAEALRQACLAQESRISQTKPELPTVCVTSLSVSNSVFLGPVQLEFNQQYNALIGGRGTGKSTILEYLRWGLCDQLPRPDPDDELPNYQLRRKTLIDKTLKSVDGVVQVGFTVNGIDHLIRRHSKTDEVFLKVGDEDFEACNESEVRALLPIQAYSQKQLSNVSVRLEELSRFVEAPVRSELDDIDKEFERGEAEIRQHYATLVRKRRLEKQVSTDELLIQSLSTQAANIRASLTGLSKEDEETLAAKENYDAAQEAIETWTGDIETVAGAVDDIVSALEELPTEIDFPELAGEEKKTLEAIRDESAKFVRTSKDLVDKMSQAIRTISDDDGALKGPIGAQLRKWEKNLEKYSEKYEQAKARASTHRAQIEQLRQIEKRAEELRKANAVRKREVSGLGKPETKYSDAKIGWLASHKKRTELMKVECQKLSERSSGEIRATVRIGAGFGQAIERFREVIAGSGIRGNKLDALGEAISNAETPVELWQAVLNELEALASHDVEEKGEKDLPSCPSLAAQGFAKSDLLRLANKLNEDSWLEISLSKLEDEPVFEYRAREAQYIPFTNASAGQQATALLKALLNQPGPPLVIDQPEEDLDNPVIEEIVDQIWSAKRARQLILASHNANLVVNGDAELVAWCDYRTAGDHSVGQIHKIGAIDVPEICAAIKKVMEGGEKAFKLRASKYGF